MFKNNLFFITALHCSAITKTKAFNQHIISKFPTQYNSNYQWWDAMGHSNAMILDSVSADIKPIVRFIDDWFFAKPPALIFECKVEKGKLVVSGIDLLSHADNRPEAKQLLYSLKSDMATSEFNPLVSVDKDKILRLFKW